MGWKHCEMFGKWIVYIIANEFSGHLKFTFSWGSCWQIFKSSHSARDGDHSILAVQWPSAQACFSYMGHLFSSHFADKCQKCANCHDGFCLSRMDGEHSFISNRLWENLYNWIFKCLAWVTKCRRHYNNNTLTTHVHWRIILGPLSHSSFCQIVPTLKKAFSQYRHLKAQGWLCPEMRYWTVKPTFCKV